MENCIFCKVAAGQIPSSIVYQDEDIVAFKDITPQAPHHILFISRRHIPSMDDSDTSRWSTTSKDLYGSTESDP